MPSPMRSASSSPTGSGTDRELICCRSKSAACPANELSAARARVTLPPGATGARVAAETNAPAWFTQQPESGRRAACAGRAARTPEALAASWRMGDLRPTSIQRSGELLDLNLTDFGPTIAPARTASLQQEAA